MKQFDALLRQGLMDANLAQYGNILIRADMAEPEFTPKYRRERMRLLADPWSWEKRRRERQAPSRRKRLVRNIACILLACTVAFGALMAASPAVRATVEKWLRQFKVEDNGGKTVTYYTSEPDETVTQHSWRPVGLPEGWLLRDLMRSAEKQTSWDFAKAGSEDNATIHFQWLSSASGGTSYGTNEKDWDFQMKTTVRGQPADYYEGEKSSMLAWTAEDGSLLILTTSRWADRETLEKIAEAVSPWTGSSVEYEAGWVPEGHTERPSNVGVGAGQLRWNESYTVLSFQYINDPICPFETPSRTPEEVTVNGCPGLYWPSMIPIEEKGAGVSGDPAYSPAVTYAIEESAVLTWEDPETNTSFRISGIIEKEDILRMAESVRIKEPS